MDVIDQAVGLLRAGELVAFPTETVYGLGADASNRQAVAKIFAAKARPADHPLIVHLPGAGHLEHWAREIPEIAWDLAESFWPGPLTLILKRALADNMALDWVTGGQDSIGLRVPAHPLALELLRCYAEAGGGLNGQSGLAAPSANRFGRISPTQAAHVRSELGERVPLILDGGACQFGIESTILDLSGDPTCPPRVLRPGHISAEQIAMVLGVLPTSGASASSDSLAQNARPRVSGSLAAHYAPSTPMQWLDAPQLRATIQAQAALGRVCAVLSHSPELARALSSAKQNTGALHFPCVEAHLPSEPQAYAQALYAALRTLDQSAAALILVERIPADSTWLAVADRLHRAVCGAGIAPA
ncbi:MAG: L-threonylcarbamoyladenylate synthase [Pseudomonadota bacterium]